MLTDLPCELERSQSRYGPQAICGTASTAVIERQQGAALVYTGIIKGRPSTHGDHYQLNTSTR